MKETASVETIQAMYDAFAAERLRWLIGKGDVLVQRSDLEQERFLSLINKTVEEEYIRSSILRNLRDGPKTVVELSEKTPLDTSIIHWNLLALAKWNKVEVIERIENQYTYGLKEIH
ncbi:MAG: hypothetical protein ACFFEF_07905 [Candidatus Thorarchaeota archaeon]